MQQGSIAIVQWLSWTIAIASAVAALVRSSVASTGGPGILRRNSGLIGSLWLLSAAAALTGFIFAVIAVRTGS